MSDSSPHHSLTRRRLCQVIGSIGLTSLAGCSEVTSRLPTADESTPSGSQPPSGPPDTTEQLIPAAGSVPVDGESFDSWLYDEQYPGPELRMNEGDTLQVDVSNQLPDPTTVHWHGIPVPNRMDGVPGITQDSIQPGNSFQYTFEVTPPGTYLYHSHVNLQLDRGLVGPLIIEEESPHVDYDEDVTLFLDDVLSTEPQLDAGDGTGNDRPTRNCSSTVDHPMIRSPSTSRKDSAFACGSSTVAARRRTVSASPAIG